MICSICNRDLPPYHFLKESAVSDDRYFFANVRRDKRKHFREDVCWSCHGGFRCLQCGNIKPASEFRVGGRFCASCKAGWQTLEKTKRGVFVEGYQKRFPKHKDARIDDNSHVDTKTSEALENEMVDQT